MQNLIFFKMLKFFLDSPYEEVYLRQLSKKLNLSVFAVKKYADLLLKEGLIKEERKANLRYFKANVNNLFFKYLKISFNIKLILNCDILNFLKENLANVSSIVLFGSSARGEDDENSDIDILVIGKDKYLSLDKFEEKLNKKVNLHIFSWGGWNEKSKKDGAFYFEIIRGIPLYGELPFIKWK